MAWQLRVLGTRVIVRFQKKNEMHMLIRRNVILSCAAAIAFILTHTSREKSKSLEYETCQSDVNMLCVHERVNEM